MKAIVVIGQRASGKSYLAASAAKMLQIPCVDIDVQLQVSHGLPSQRIGQLHGRLGDVEFRAREFDILQNNINTACILATGGGTIITPQAQRLLQPHPWVLFLDVDPQICYSRIERQGHGYLGSYEREQWQEFFEKRRPLYQSLAKVVESNFEDALKRIVQWHENGTL